ncbi:MAG: hypothetical protein Ct9H300mP28_32050 [Pseudomonadota bacterium]|nr:MAG: hypothetical protein Ct9H300mP28_32050 [Pseudomonadota bacterium]
MKFFFLSLIQRKDEYLINLFLQGKGLKFKCDSEIAGTDKEYRAKKIKLFEQQGEKQFRHSDFLKLLKDCLAPFSGFFCQRKFLKTYKSLVLLIGSKIPINLINRKEYFIMLLPVMF